ncbi:MAG: hypothetical protein HQ530_03520 [Parcubacteria group bacterium]|nr:hypothetical protein [Parcubacteria group bacterium]
MRKNVTVIEFDISTKPVWPRFCILCLKPTTAKGLAVAGIEGNVPHCNDCHVKITRFDKWQDSIFTPAAITAFIIGLAFIVAGVIQEGGIGDSAFAFITGVIIAIFVLFILVYALFYLALMPFRLIFRSRLAKPGVKVLKGKKSGVIALKFSNRNYADKFQVMNGLMSQPEIKSWLID